MTKLEQEIFEAIADVKYDLGGAAGEAACRAAEVAKKYIGNAQIDMIKLLRRYHNERKGQPFDKFVVDDYRIKWLVENGVVEIE